MPNTQGTDYFVGDIHGHFRQLSQALAAVGFCPQRDRLVGVGDLLDRGEDSDVAAEWLCQSFFHTVRGNHEGLYLAWRDRRHAPAEQQRFEEELYFPNGGAWVRSLEEEEHQALEALVRNLPYFLTVPSPDGRVVGVVHAELPDGATWPSILANAPDADMIEAMTWSRDRFRHAKAVHNGRPSRTPAPKDGNRIAGLDALVCGHAGVRQPQALGNILYLDTGGWHRRGRFSVLSMDQVLGQVQAASR